MSICNTVQAFDATASGNAQLFIQVENDGQEVEALRIHYKRATEDISGYVVHHYDGATPNIRFIDMDDDPPYIGFQVAGTGTLDAPEFDNRFGGRGPTAGATTGFKWTVNGVEISTMDTEFFEIPQGTTANEPTAWRSDVF